MSEALEQLTNRSRAEPFRGFQCWQPADVGEIMNREAAFVSPAVLLATHQPPRITQVSIPTGGRYPALDVVAQDDCLEAIMEHDDPALLAPIIGQPGTGKSHLVLWMKAQLEQEDAPNRKLIYLPKGETSLAAVIELLLDGRTGGDFDKIRESVDKASKQMSASDQATRLRDELALALGRLDELGDDPMLVIDRDAIDVLAELLPHLLRDPNYDHRLLGEGRVLRRIVDEARSGAREEPAEILEADFEVGLSVAELNQLSALAREALSELNSSGVAPLAVELLNKLLPRCLSRVYGIEPMQLVGVMRQVRELLFQENPELELILMVEDFTLLQGIQYDLLEAMIELPQREGVQLLCPMKTIMAVTGGFLQRMLQGNDGLRTRLQATGKIYSLDVAYGEDRDAISTDALVDFTARYLNAVRLGVKTIDGTSPDLPNACAHCSHQSVCHAAFGAPEQTGYGVYPFNADALDRVVQSRQRSFNPRDLLGVIVETLTTRVEEFTDGRFPSESWARQFEPLDHGRPRLKTLPLAVRGQAPKPDQRDVLLTFWGGVPETLCNLDPGIHEAFDIPEIPEAQIHVRKRKPTGADPPRADVTDDLEKINDDVQAWFDGTQLSAPRALVIRHSFQEAIWHRVDPEGSLYSPAFTKAVFGNLADVVIPNSAGGGGAGRDHFRVHLRADRDTALLFVAILCAHATGGWRFENGVEHLVSFLARVDAEADRLRAHIDARLAADRDRRVAATQLLALAGLANGAGGASDTAGLLDAATAAPSEPAEALPDAWRSLTRMTQAHRRPVRDFVTQAAHISLSRNDPMAVDGSSLTPALQALAKNWEIPAEDHAFIKPAQSLQAVLTTLLPKALEAAHAALQDWDAAISPQLGDRQTVTKRAKAWIAVLERAQAKGFLASQGRWQDLDPVVLQRTVSVVDACLQDWGQRALGPQLALGARLPWVRLGPTRRVLSVVSGTLEQSIRKAQEQIGTSAGADALTRFERNIDALTRAARISEVGQ